ncbi:Predicted ATPase [Actinopolymorpha cephalotaxi]|uniref:ATPase/DNA-binding SARP family transcriptional activator n=1 Tax=Actinopolymorpha cephalotaxi TaxID=504797 RepID=A0A1I2ZH56_9ACTN|nr:BTAD domain-containing putative transcriptional regulator [Actinopolymorpha cephalotaxi]NYH81988.1 putative ATPase/DNA-binding SARP family transcriptional activator [Actinopolymorpha cephalotaxi]SFH37064.1 Predicted ATPase [Actinopolymorpha cephalotaxi]
MRFGILGPTRAWRDDGSEVSLGGPVRRALLTLLLARAGEVVPADRLVDDLYGDRPPAGAGHALQSQVSRLRQALRPEVAVEGTATGYRLAVLPNAVDVAEFERLAGEGRAALAAGRPRQAAEVLRAALDLWRGEPLADAAEAESVRGDVVRLTEGHLGALEDLIEADLALGGQRAVVPRLRDLVGRHPLRERLHLLLVRALRGDGRQAEALAAYEDVRRLLADELGTDPGPDLTALHRDLLRGEAGPRPSPLPAQLTSFVGRDEDVERVEALLGSGRLVTLVGPGGVGKTRLAVEVAGRHQEVCLVELAPLRTADGLAHAVLAAAGLREGGLFARAADADPADRLVAALADRPLLLVLDNCEHLVEPVAAFAHQLLSAVPALRVLATSREPLGITGEQLWPVRGLAAPAADRLFADRAAAVRPDFVPGRANEDVVRRICASLDGLPLAIELAAARLRTLDVADLADRLDASVNAGVGGTVSDGVSGTRDEQVGDRFAVLSRGSRTADARHRTLRAVVAWSFDLLTPAEQAMARRLSVFAGGATAASAAHVCGWGVAAAEELLDSLADKSLVEVEQGRYRMLATIAAYGAERLAAAGETQGCVRAHADHFLSLAATADPHLRRAEQLTWLGRLDAELDNLLAALRRTVEAGDAERAAGLFAATAPYLWMRGLRGAVAGPAVALLDLLGSDPPAGTEDGYLLAALTAAADRAGRPAWERHRATAESLVTATPRHHPTITFLWPMINAVATDARIVLAVLRSGLDSPDPWERAVARVIWGYPLLAAGDLDSAGREFSAAADGFGALGDRWGTAFALDALAGRADLSGDHARALALTDEALALTEQLDAAEDIADLLCNRGDYRLRAAGPAAGEAARADYERAAAVAGRVGSRTYTAGALRGLGDVARLAGNLDEAARCYHQALDRLDPHWVKSSGHRTRALVGLGRIAQERGDLTTARARVSAAAAAAVSWGPLTDCALAVEALAGIALADADPAAAVRLLAAAGGLRGGDVPDAPDVARIRADARTALGEDAYAAAHAAGTGLSQAAACRLAGVPEEVLASSPRDLAEPLTGRPLTGPADGGERSV